MPKKTNENAKTTTRFVSFQEARSFLLHFCFIFGSISCQKNDFSHCKLTYKVPLNDSLGRLLISVARQELPEGCPKGYLGR